MAEAPIPVIEVPDDISGTVIVRDVTPSGEIEFLPPSDDNPDIISPSDVKVPIPNYEAYKLIHVLLFRRKLYWEQIQGEALEYNIFFHTTATENNICYPIYGVIVGMLILEPIKLPEVGDIGTCRISPFCDPDDLYVQPEPTYVDTVAYFIYVAILEKRQTKLLQRAQNIEVDGMYIYAEGPKQYRVRFLERIVETEPSWFQDFMRNRVLRERQTIVSTAYTPGDVDDGRSTSKRSREDISGEKRNDSDEVIPRFEWSERDIFDRTFGEKVKVFRVDYGGQSITVHRADLYIVNSVYPELNEIEDLAIPVNVQYINDSDVDKEARLGDLRNRKQIINITTVSEAIGDTRAIVNIFHEQYLE